jgi:putative protease
LVEEKRPGEFFPLEQDGRGTYILNSKDLCLLEEIGPLMGLGIDSFKIEGRMKGALYVASVARAYRQAIDRCARQPSAFQVEPAWMEDLQRVSHRPYTKGGLFAGEQTGAAEVERRISYVQTHTLAGLVRSDPEQDASSVCGDGGQIFFEVRSRLVPGQTLEFLNPDGSTSRHMLGTFEDSNGNRLTQANPNMSIRFCVDFPAFAFQAVRVRNSEE